MTDHPITKYIQVFNKAVLPFADVVEELDINTEDISHEELYSVVRRNLASIITARTCSSADISDIDFIDSWQLEDINLGKLVNIEWLDIKGFSGTLECFISKEHRDEEPTTIWLLSEFDFDAARQTYFYCDYCENELPDRSITCLSESDYCCLDCAYENLFDYGMHESLKRIVTGLELSNYFYVSVEHDDLEPLIKKGEKLEGYTCAWVSEIYDKYKVGRELEDAVEMLKFFDSHGYDTIISFGVSEVNQFYHDWAVWIRPNKGRQEYLVRCNTSDLLVAVVDDSIPLAATDYNKEVLRKAFYGGSSCLDAFRQKWVKQGHENPLAVSYHVKEDFEKWYSETKISRKKLEN